VQIQRRTAAQSYMTLFDNWTRLKVDGLSGGALWCIVGSTHAFGSIGLGLKSEHRLFSHHIYIYIVHHEITGEVLTGQFCSSTAIAHSAIYHPGRWNRVAAYQW